MKRNTFVLAGLIAVGACNPIEANQAAKTQQGQTPQGLPGNVQQGGWNPVGQTPWFSNPGVQKQLNINGAQFNQLNRAYGNAWNTYQTNLKQLNADTKLSPTDRAQRMQEAEGTFYKNFAAGTDTLKNEAFRQRFDQVGMQYRRYGAFNDPMVQEKLSLTPEQRQKLNQYNQQWTNQMNGINGVFSKDPTTASKQFTEMHKQYDDRINSVLNQQQQLTWQRMLGEAHNFQPEAYFQAGSQRPPTTTPSDK